MREEMDDEIDNLFDFFKERIAPEKRKAFMLSIGFGTVCEIKELDDELKKAAIINLVIEKRKRMTVWDIRFTID